MGKKMTRDRPVREMSSEELRREHEVVSAWIRDINTPKRARLREILKEIERREQGCA